MLVWLYYRLTRVEDDELNSLSNQRKIIYEYAVTNLSLIHICLYEDDFLKEVSGHSRQAEETERRLKEKELKSLLARDDELDLSLIHI